MQYILILNSPFNGGLFLNFNFDIIMTFFEFTFSFSIHDRHNAIISKFYYASIFFLKCVHIF
jgi:hypothetical protein